MNSALLTPTGDLTDDTAAILRSYARRFARPCNLDPAELFQECCLYLLRRAADYDPERGSLSTWLWHVAARSRNYLVRQHRLVGWSAQRPAALSDADPDPGPGPADEIERADLCRRVRDAVAALPPAERELVVRRYGLDGSEPARRLADLVRDRSRETARLRLQRATDRLRRELVACR
jgi:RNA polymerase sigma-70 factor (ECF subfamily)